MNEWNSCTLGRQLASQIYVDVDDDNKEVYTQRLLKAVTQYMVQHNCRIGAHKSAKEAHVEREFSESLNIYLIPLAPLFACYC